MVLQVAYGESPEEIATRAKMRGMLKKHETKWRDTYKHELAKPILNSMPESQSLFPSMFSNLYLGMTEDDLCELRPGLNGGNVGTSVIREVYEFVPGRLTEELAQGDWRSVTYQIRRKRLAIARFTSRAKDEQAHLDKAGREMCSKFLKHLGKPTEIRAIENLRGKPNKVMLIWQKGNIFTMLLSTKENGKYFLNVMVGTQPYFEDQMKLYDFADLSPEAAESLVRERCPYLKELSQEVD